MPEQPQRIIDSHLHIIDPSRFDYAWLERRRDIKQVHSLDDYSAASSPANVTGVIAIEAAAEQSQGCAEAEWLHRQTGAPGTPPIIGIVAQARLERGDLVEDELQRLRQVPRLVGIRRVVRAPFQTDPDFCIRDDFIRGVRRLEAHGLTFDIACASTDLPNVATLVSRCPDTRFILNHMGNPPHDRAAWAKWRHDLRSLATAENVVCKISGLPVHLPVGWTSLDAAPHVREAIEAFGPDRVLFASDFPVHNPAGGFRAWFDTCRDLLAGASDDERSAFFWRNAARTYGLRTFEAEQPQVTALR